MNAWRCGHCHHLFTDTPLRRDGNLLTCPICGDMVCNVTHTKMGKEFLTQQANITGDEQQLFMNKKIISDDGAVQ
jgi:hypothetical protein